MSEKKAVYIPVELYSKVEKRASEAGFSSVEEYVTFVLEEVVKEEEEYEMSREEEEEVKKRLRALGYLD